MDTLQTLAANIRALRGQSGMTQEALAARLSLTFQAVSKWENAQSAPDVTLLPALADIFGVTLDALFGRDTPSAALPWADDDVCHAAMFRGHALLAGGSFREDIAADGVMQFAVFQGDSLLAGGSFSRDGALPEARFPWPPTPPTPSAPLPWADDAALHLAAFRGRTLLESADDCRELTFTLTGDVQTVDCRCGLHIDGNVEGNVANVGGHFSCDGSIGGDVGGGIGGHFSCSGEVGGDVSTNVGGHFDCGDVGGDISLTAVGGSFTCSEVGGDAATGMVGGNFACGDIGGDLHVDKAQGLRCGNVEGDVNAGGGVNCGNVGGDVTPGGGVSCGNVGGDVTPGGGVNCGNVEGDVNAGGDVSCGDVGGDASAQRDLRCHAIEGDASAASIYYAP